MQDMRREAARLPPWSLALGLGAYGALLAVGAASESDVAGDQAERPRLGHRRSRELRELGTRHSE